MFINIFDVGHGGCSVVTCPNGVRIMIDCGFRLDPPWFPSVTFKESPIDLLALSNLDEDHLKDLAYVLRNVPVYSIFTNPTITSEALALMKRTGGMGRGVQAIHSILERFWPGLIGSMAWSGNVRAWAYFNRYGVDFSDTNNLSLAIFIRYGTFTILYAGDLESAGWRALLRKPAFVADLKSVTMFVTSHHGRENGCCEEVFRFCRPEVFIVSDGEHLYASQDTLDWYRRRARGIPVLRPWPYRSRQQRYVLTTRCDGNLNVGVRADGCYLVTSERPAPELNWPLVNPERDWLHASVESAIGGPSLPYANGGRVLSSPRFA